MKMWSGRFREPLDHDFEQWQRSLAFDWQLLPQEVAASKAHARTIAAAGILTEAELGEIAGALDAIRDEYAQRPASDIYGRTEAEDIHHFVELELVARIGEGPAVGLHPLFHRAEKLALPLGELDAGLVRSSLGAPQGVESRALGLRPAVGRTSLHRPPIAVM